MSSSFTVYAQNFISNVSPKSKSIEPATQNINYYINNSNVIINGEEKMQNQLILINRKNQNENLMKNKKINEKQKLDENSKEYTNCNIITRKDAHGVPIIKGQKKHKVSFKQIIDKVSVESFKKYNNLNTFDEKENPSIKHNQVTCCYIY